jgi:hypothetical protein
LIYERNEGESPERVLLTDKALITTIIVWGLMTVGLIYYVELREELAYWAETQPLKFLSR